MCVILKRKEDKRLQNNKDNRILYFDIESAEAEEYDQDSRFMIARIRAFSSDKNRHDMYCSEDVLKETAPSIYGTPIVYNIQSNMNDFASHNTDPSKALIAGYVVPNTATFERLDDGRLSLNVVAHFWKRYAPKVVQILKREDGKSRVSVEMELLDAEDMDNGLTNMKSFRYLATCLLGQNVTEASPGAMVDVLSFAEESKRCQTEYKEALMTFSNKYADIDFVIPEKIKKNALTGLSLYQEHGVGGTSFYLAIGRHLTKNEKVSTDKVKLIHKFLSKHIDRPKNKENPDANYISLMIHGGEDALSWSTNIVNAMKAIDEKQLSYFSEIIGFPYGSMKDVNPAIKGIDPPVSLAQANQIARQAESIGTDEDKNGWAIAISSFKKTHKVEDGKWVKKEKEKKEEFSVKIKKTDGIRNAETKFSLTSKQIMELLNSSLSEFKYGKDDWRKYWVYEFDDVYAYVSDNSDSKNYRIPYSLDGTNVSVDESKKEEVIEGMPLPVQKEEYAPEFAEDEPKKSEDGDLEKDKGGAESPKEEEPKEETKMSLDMNLDMAALLAMLQDETEDYKALAAEHESGGVQNYASLMSQMYAKMCKMADDAKKAQEDRDTYMAENEQLKKFKKDTENAQFSFEVETTLNEVSEFGMPKNEIDKMREKSKEFSLENVEAWKNEVKAIAFTCTKGKGKKDDGITKMAFPWLQSKKEKTGLYWLSKE